MRDLALKSALAGALLSTAACGVVSISVGDKDIGRAHASNIEDIKEIIIPVSDKDDYESVKAFYRQAKTSDAQSGEKRIIIIPGSPSDAAYWGAAMEALDPAADVYAVERPGFKGSGPNRAVTDLDEQASVIASLIQSAPNELYLVGNSLGASIALKALDAHRDRFKGVILVSPYVFPVKGKEKRWFDVYRFSPLRFATGTASHRFAKEVSAQRKQSPEIIDIARKTCTPTLILQGDLDDTVPVLDAEAVRDLFPDCAAAEYALIEGGDHYLAVHNSLAIAGRINAFIAKTNRQAETSAP